MSDSKEARGEGSEAGKRKRKKQNLSMHQLDAATQESIQATIASERGHMDVGVEDQIVLAT